MYSVGFRRAGLLVGLLVGLYVVATGRLDLANLEGDAGAGHLDLPETRLMMVRAGG